MSKSILSIILTTLILFFLTPLAHPDTITLKTGGTVKGLITQDKGDKIVVKVKFGNITLKKDNILNIDRDPDYFLNLADGYFREKDYEEALNAYETILSSYKDDVDLTIIKYNIARCYLKLKLPYKALPYLEELKEASMLDEQTEALFSDLIEKDKKANLLYQKAEEGYYKIKSLKWHYTNLPKYNGVIDDCKRIIGDFPDTEVSLHSQLLIIQCYEEQAEHEKRFEALDKYTNIVAHYYDEEKAMKIIKDTADELFSKKEYSDAILYFEKLLKKYPNCKEVTYARYQIGLVYEALDRPEESIKMYKRLIKEASDQNWQQMVWARISYAYGEIAYNYVMREEFDKAVGLLRRAMAENPNDYDYQATLQCGIARIRVTETNFSEAIIEFQKVVDNYPESQWAGFAERGLRNAKEEMQRRKK